MSGYGTFYQDSNEPMFPAPEKAKEAPVFDDASSDQPVLDSASDAGETLARTDAMAIA